MKTVHTALLLIAALLCFAVNADTLTWTGAAGDNQWINYANWSGATSSTDFSAAHDYVFNNLADGANIKIPNGKTIILKSLTMAISSPSARNWTFSGVDSSARIRTVSTGTIKIPSGCSLTISVTASNPWNGTYNGFHLEGGGQLRISASWEGWGGTIYVKDATLVNAYAASYQSGFGTMYVTLQSDNAVFRAEKATYVRMNANSSGTVPTVDVNGNSFYAEVTGDITYSGRTIGGAGSVFGMLFPRKFTFATAPAMIGTYAAYNGDLFFGSAANPVSIPTESTLDVRRNGSIYLFGDQTVSAIKGEGTTGTIDIQSGKTLTIAGIMGELTATTYNGRLSGGGDIVKRGAAYDLRLTGDSEAFTGSVEVAEGKLVLTDTNRFVDDDIVVYAPFDGNDWNKENLTSEGFGGIVYDWNVPYTYCDRPEKVLGDGVFGDCIRLESGDTHGCRWRLGTDKTASKKIDRSNWTMSIWIRPSADPGTSSRSGHFFNLGSWGDNADIPYVLALIQFEYSVANNHCRIRDYSNNVVTPNMPELVDGNWHHVVYIQEPRAKYLWVDGVLRAQKTDFTRDIFPSSDIQIGGKDTWGGNSTYRGDLDELIVANGSWTEERILREYHRCHVPESYAAKPLPKPIARWTFDENFVDSVGGIELVNGGSTAVEMVSITGASGKCIDLKSNCYLKLKSSSYPAAFPTGKQPFTMSMRQRYRSSAEYTFSYVMGDILTANKFFGVGMIGGYRYPYLRWSTVGSQGADISFQSSPNSTAAPTTSPLGWDHVIATFDGTNVIGYIDGYLNTTKAATSINLASGVIYMGYQPNAYQTASIYFNGYVDDVTIWTNCLTQSQCREVVRSFQRDFARVGQLVNAPVTVNEGATVLAEGLGNEIKALHGDGELSIARNSAIKVGSADFEGSLVGSGLLEIARDSDLSGSNAGRFYGRLLLDGGVLRLNSSYADCSVTLASGGVTGGAAPVEVLPGATLSIDAAAQDVAGVSTSGELTLPDEATVVIDGTPPEGDMLIAEAGSLNLPADFSKWHLPGGAGRYRLRIKDNKLYLVIRRGIAVIYF